VLFRSKWANWVVRIEHTWPLPHTPPCRIPFQN